jgi:hypothetical protein
MNQIPPARPATDPGEPWQWAEPVWRGIVGKVREACRLARRRALRGGAVLRFGP